MGYDNWKKDIDILDNHLKDKSEYKDKSNQEKAKLILDKTLSVYLGEDKADIQIPKILNDKFNIKLSQEQIDSSIKKSQENSNEKLWDNFREKGILSTLETNQDKSSIKNIVEKIKAPFKPKVKQQSKNQDKDRK
ncbi:hypothetical protein [Aliarcobacter cryaerophilus]|uniref:Uncharacterized protein n=1 Tax=Aliarcobacter cryaerophilus TaxID=28198 RepID=A0AA46S1D8_9BACT|nr:hypothetical protein [Aliarcobacter cryaerophilus]UYF42518.1 hypothetical protein NGX11_06300 [Aliarcobacter cryaerophilus]